MKPSRRGGAALSQRVAFDEPAGTDDGYGGKTPDWAERFRCDAEMRHMGGAEAVRAAREAAVRTFKVRVPACSDLDGLTEAWRMRDVRRGDAYNVRDVDRITDRNWIWLVAEGPLAKQG
ncbi:MAG: phage head closure protein [Mameliella sp.]|nr:phage head closure protein [Mameliella sp.]